MFGNKLLRKKSSNLIKQTRAKLLILVALLCLALAACGDPTASNQPGNAAGATATPATTANITPTNPPDTVPVVATSTPLPTSSSNNNPATATPKPTQPGYNPLIRFSSNTIKGKGDITVSGSGYPANTKLAVRLSKEASDLTGIFANPVSDAQGNFSVKVGIAVPESGMPLDPGKWIVQVTTQDGKIGAGAPITIIKEDSQPIYKPVISASPQSLNIGEEVEIRGSGYPANTTIKLVGGVQNPGLVFAILKTDGAGSFVKKVKMDVEPTQRAIPFQPGPFTFATATEDDKPFQPVVTIQLIAPQDEGTKLGNAFFAKIINDDLDGAAKMLSAKQQLRIQNGQTTIPQMLGLGRKPYAAEVFASTVAKGYNYKAVIHLSGGDKISYLLIGQDTDGSTKIIDVSTSISA